MEQKKSIYQLAGEWGIPFGLYLSCAAVAQLFADQFPPLSLVFLLMVLGTPLLVYAFQRRKFIADDGFTEYAALWMLGIMLFLLGALLSGLAVYVVLQYIRPGLLYELGQQVIDTYSKMPEMKDSETLHIIKRMVNEQLMPSPLDLVISTYWFVTFGGSVLSAITALPAQRQLAKHRRRPTDNDGAAQ